MIFHAPGRARRLSGAGTYNASCSCGWTSPNRVTASRAYRDIDEHIQPAITPPEGATDMASTTTTPTPDRAPLAVFPDVCMPVVIAAELASTTYNDMCEGCGAYKDHPLAVDSAGVLIVVCWKGCGHAWRPDVDRLAVTELV